MPCTSPTGSLLDRIIEEMRGASLDITVKDDYWDFLEVKVTKKPDGTYRLTEGSTGSNLY
jgi:hypothetical protein